MGMIERVARALIGVEGAPIDACVEDMLPMSRAAIEAMREPSKGMACAGFDEQRHYSGLIACYTAMIDAALAEDE